MILIWVGCAEEPLRGCTNCNAVNFNEYANEDDDSCILINTARLGEYNRLQQCGLEYDLVDDD